jgi:hypothetical protein
MIEQEMERYGRILTTTLNSKVLRASFKFLWERLGYQSHVEFYVDTINAWRGHRDRSAKFSENEKAKPCQVRRLFGLVALYFWLIMSYRNGVVDVRDCSKKKRVIYNRRTTK